MSRDEVIKRLTAWLLARGFTLMDDGTYHHVDYVIRVEFKKMVVRIDYFDDRYRAGFHDWIRLISAHYKRVQFDVTGRPHGIGFNSFPALRRIAGDEVDRQS